MQIMTLILVLIINSFNEKFVLFYSIVEHILSLKNFIYYRKT
jgi:hypothetical protein